MVNIQQKSEEINMQIETSDDLYVQNIENLIIDILNQNKVTSEQFDKIITDLFEQKESATLMFSDAKYDRPNDKSVAFKSLVSKPFLTEQML